MSEGAFSHVAGQILKQSSKTAIIQNTNKKLQRRNCCNINRSAAEKKSICEQDQPVYPRSLIRIFSVSLVRGLVICDWMQKNQNDP